MASIKENVPGRYYVDEQCIGCGICSEIAPQNFKSNHRDGYDYVYKQPCSREERRMCAEAVNVCPVNAIGDDGVKTTSAGG
jgi:ferredoxin